jgi:hypothetical protein
VYGNGSSFNNTGCGPPYGCTFGPEFQCTELAQRYAHYAWGEPANWYGFGGAGGDAASMWVSGPALPLPLMRFTNGGGAPPQQGDLMIFGSGWLGGFWDGTGHVAIVRDIGPNYVDIVQQNATPSGTDRLAVRGSLVTASGYTPVVGWLRNTLQSSLPLGANNVAGTPQTISDQAGDMDVVWRGTDSRLWTIGYRNQRWAGQATPISPANAVSDPSLVSAAAGKIEVFWRGTDGGLWHNVYQAGFYGSGAWGAAAALDPGPLQSAPHAVSVDGSATEVFWKGPSGSLELARFAGATSTRVTVSTTLAGDPYPVALGSGAAAVFWRDPTDTLWMDQIMSWGQGPPQQLGVGSPSDPTPVSGGDGNVDLFWRGADRALWHLGVTGSRPGAPELISAQSMLGRPSAAEPSPGTITLVLQRSDGKLATVLALPGIGWVGPELLGDGPVGSDPSLLAYASRAFSVFWRGQNGGLWYSAACPGCSPSPPPALAQLP